MDETADLIATLDVGRIPQVDLDMILQWCFPRGRMEPEDPLSVTYSAEAGDALKVVYNQAGDVVQLVPLDYWSDELAAKLRREIDREAVGGIKKIRRTWAFTHRPVSGTWRYRDVFQICEAPADAPKPGFLVAEHPLVLEVSFTSSEVSFPLGLDRSLTASRRVELLLSVLLGEGFHVLPQTARRHWVYIEQQRDPLVLSSEFLQQGYTADGFVPELLEFSAPGASMATVDIFEHIARPWTGPRDVLAIPVELTALLDAFYILHPGDRNQFLRACYWFQYASGRWQVSRSAAFLGFIQAIETLQPTARVDGHCRSCNRSIGPGPTQQFIEFVEEHAPGLPKKRRQELYKVRSSLSHGSALLMHDEYAGFGWRFTPSQAAETHDIETAQVVAQVTLVSWLTRRGLEAARRGRQLGASWTAEEASGLGREKSDG